MSLFSPGPHTVDVFLVNDSTKSGRGFIGQARTTVASGVNCRVNERGVSSVQAFGREQAKHTHHVQFGSNPELLDSHLLRWVRPDDGKTVYLKVLGMKRPQSNTMPYVAYCTLSESGE